MSSHNLEETIHRAVEMARSRRHEFVTLEHLLLRPYAANIRIAMRKPTSIAVAMDNFESVRFSELIARSKGGSSEERP